MSAGICLRAPLLAALLLMGPLLALAAPGAESHLDRSTPEATLKTFMAAFREGDAKTLAAVSTGERADEQWLAAQASAIAAARELDRAVAKRFGKEYSDSDEGTDLHDFLREFARNHDLETDLKAAKPRQIDASHVLFVVEENQPDFNQPQLVKDAGGWKLELRSLANYFVVEDAAGLAATAKEMNNLAREVRAARFKSLEEAAKQIRERIDQVQSQALPPAAPTPPPAKAPARRP
jgi:hypothetical protein